MTLSILLRVFAVAGLAVSTAAAQSIVSARSGAIHHIQGDVYLDGEAVEMEFAKFPNMVEGSVLETGRGRAEILLTPGVILRLAENSSVKMLSNQLNDTQIEFLTGSALVEAMELLDGNKIAFRVNDAVVNLDKAGLYRIDDDPPQLRVYDGKAWVYKDDEKLKAKKGRVVELGTFLAASKFDAKQDDELYRWSSRRSGYLAMANLSAARSLDRWGTSWSRSGWLWNPYFGMFTFVPGYGAFSSPFGYSFWSPARVYMVYNPPRVYSGGGGGGGMSSGGGVYSPRHGYVVTGSRGVSSGASSSSSGGGAAASSGGVSRGGGASVGRGGSSGGGRGR